VRHDARSHSLRCAGRTFGVLGCKTATSGFWALYDFCMTFRVLMDGNERDGKSRKVHTLKTAMWRKPLIYLAETAVFLVK
jgi:hypothetical protein